jgi:hypothetical protein
MTEVTVDQLRAFDQELRQRDPRFLRVCSANPDEGQGEYEVRTMTGQTARQVFTFEGDHVITPSFDAATRARFAADATAAPDPYKDGLKKLRDASETTESVFEDRYKAERRRELGLETK